MNTMNQLSVASQKPKICTSFAREFASFISACNNFHRLELFVLNASLLVLSTNTYQMSPAATKNRTVAPVVEIKRLDPCLSSRIHECEYPGLAKGTKVLVTTGGAIADSAISLLTAAGCNVTILGPSPRPAHAATRETKPEITPVEGSVMSPEACAKAVIGQDVVLHAGRPAADAEARRSAHEGTRQLLSAAAGAGVKAFVFVSSASVVFDGKDLREVSEDAPYASHFIDPYTAAVAEAEKEVLRANSTTGRGVDGPAESRRAGASTPGMSTCSVRASWVYGPGESEYLLPGLAARTKAGARPIGDGRNVVDFVFSGNVAHALILAAQQLLTPPGDTFDPSRSPRSTAAAGRAFHVTDAEPVPFSDFAGRALSRLGYPGPDDAGSAAGIPVAVAAVLVFLLRVWALMVSPFFDFRPILTARRVAEESKVWRFDISRARKELGYKPLWTQEEGLEISLHSAESLRNPLAKVKHIGPFTADEVARHSTEDDAWIIVDDKVYDVTPYLGQHPGGDAILRNAGGDSTKGMHGPQHPAQAMEILEQHFIGLLET